MTQTWKADADTALIVVDMNNDFVLQEGALSVKNAEEIIPAINELTPHFDQVIWTKEEHDADHEFFANNREGKKPLDKVETEYGTQYLWPEHCVKGSFGAEFHKDLVIGEEDMIVVKGTDKTIHAYSAVYMDDRKTVIRYDDGKTFENKLNDQGIKKAVVVGVAGDFCPGYLACDLANLKYQVYYVKDVTRSINIDIGDGRTTQDLMDDMLEDAKVIVTTAQELPKLLTNKNTPA